jgi:hypothetical protein
MYARKCKHRSTTMGRPFIYIYLENRKTYRHQHEICILIFSTTSVQNISLSDKYLASSACGACRDISRSSCRVALTCVQCKWKLKWLHNFFVVHPFSSRSMHEKEWWSASNWSSAGIPITHSLNHSWRWALLKKLPIVQLFKNFPAFYGTRRFITVFTRALHWSLSW